MRKQIFIFRHGETNWNIEGRIQGHLDIPLNDTGRAQAAKLIAPLARLGIEAILSSDLSRAHETAEIIARGVGIPVHKSEQLREAHLGTAQGKTAQELGWKSVFNITDADAGARYPGGESVAEVRDRVFAGMEAFLREQSYTRIGVASHGGVIRRVAHHVLPAALPPVPIPNGILYLLEFDIVDGKWEFIPHLPLRSRSQK